LARLLEGVSGSVVTSIWEDLKAKYKELEEVGEWLATDPRMTVVGEPAARPRELFEALFGPATGALEPEERDGAWQIYASFQVESPPGGGTIGAAGDEERALCYLRETDVVLLCVLDGRPPTKTELALYDHVTRLRRIYAVVVMTPTDAPATDESDGEHLWVARELELRRAFADQQLPCYRNQRLLSTDLVKLARYIHERLDRRLRLKLISRLQHEASRDNLVREMIHSMSRTAAFLGVNPIPYADAIAILPVQVLLVCRVAAAYGQKITVKDRAAFSRVAALVGCAGVGFREVYRAVKRRLKDPDLPLQMGLGAAIAWVGTEVIGHAARLHFGSHGSIPPAAARRQAATIVAEQSLLGSLMV